MQPTPNQRQSRLPAYLQVAQILRERISEGSYYAAEFLPPERDLAAELKVSRQTIRQAIEVLRHEGVVVPEQGRGTRVVASAPSSSHTALTSKFQLAALIIYGMSRESSAAICQGCASVMHRADYHLIIAETAVEKHLRAEEEAAHLRALLDKGIEGIIIYAEPTARNRALLKEALTRGVKVVQIDRFLPELPCDYVGIDNITAAREMGEHLIRAGHRRIAFYSAYPEPSTCKERLFGFQQALLAQGIPEDRELIGYRESVEHQIACWLALPKPPTAIFCMNDELAVLVLQALRKMQISVPSQMAVVGFDNLRATSLVMPGITTVEQPFGDLGATAAQLLLNRMPGHAAPGFQKVLLPTRLVLRQSCGGVPIDRSLAAVRL